MVSDNYIALYTCIKNISENNKYSVYQKIKLIADALTEIRDTKEYFELIKNNIYLKRVINSSNEKDIELISEDLSTSYIIEDYNKYEYYIDADFYKKKKDSELSEIIGFYSEYYPNLLPDEKINELIIRAQKNDKKARDEIINHSWRRVLSIALKYRDRGVEIVDMFQEGNIGLMRAIDKYRFDKNAKFGTYATWWIRQMILRLIEVKGRLISLPVNYSMQYDRLKRTIAKLEKELNRQPTIVEIAKEMSMKIETVENMLYTPEVCTSLDQYIDEKKKHSYFEIIKDNETLSVEEQLEYKEWRQNIGLYIGTLSEREQEIIKMYYGFYDDREYVLEEIGNKFNITRERVRQIKNSAEKKLMEIFREKGLAYASSIEEKESNNKKLVEVKFNKKGNDIYSCFYDETREDIDLVISCLSEKMKKILEKKFLNGNTSMKRDDFSKLVRPTMIRRLKQLKMYKGDKYEYIEKIRNDVRMREHNYYKSKIKTIYEYYDEYTKEDIDLVLSSLDERIKNVCNKRFNKDECNSKIKRDFSYNISHCVKRKLEILKRQRVREAIKNMDYNTPYIEDVNEAIKSILVVGLKNGYIAKRCFNNAEISQIFNIEEEKVDDTISIALSLYNLDELSELSGKIYLRYNKDNTIKGFKKSIKKMGNKVKVKKNDSVK